MLTAIVITAVVSCVIAGGLGYWIGKKGAANVAGDVRIATQDIEKKV